MANPQSISPARAPVLGPALAEFTRRIALELGSNTPELPGFPEVALRVREVLSQDDVSIDAVVRIVSVEPSLSVRLLQLANSVALNPAGQRVGTLRAAISRIGFNLARSATIAFAMSQMRRGEAWRGLENKFRATWDTSARLAAMSYVLARHCERADADQAMLAGMLQAVGRLFVITRLSPFPVLLGDAAMCAEIEHVWQSRAGHALLAHWDLAPDVIDAACDFDLARLEAERPATLSDVLLAARYLVGIHDTAEIAGAPFLHTPPFLRLGIDEHGICEVLQDSAAEVTSLRAALAD